VDTLMAPITAKAARLLAAGRLRVLEVRPGELIRAVCQGDHGRYRLGWWHGRRGCARRAGHYARPCAHLVALRLIVNDPDQPTPLQANNPHHRSEVSA
jgi:hypothetical protein